MTQQQQQQPKASPDFTLVDEDAQKEMYTIVSNYQPKYSDELKLEAGERVQVLSKEFCHSGNLGWWTGRTGNGQVGIFPATLVRQQENSTPCYVENTSQSTGPLVVPFTELSLHEVVGVGGFGMVHRATWRNKEVAVKIAKHATVAESTKILEEAKKFAVLSHPNICSLLCTCTSPPTMIIQYAAGGNLSDVLHKEKISLSTSTIVSWASQIASGMDYLHNGLQQPLIHRDLKSCNILLEHKIDCNNLSANNLLISDFGLAHELQHTTRVTGAGTYAWMAPEALMSTVSKGSDIWSYGVVLWELLTGEIPYRGLEGVAIAFGVGTFTLSLPIPNNCPAAFSELLTDCWKRDSHDRPSFSTILKRLSSVTPEFLSTPPETFQSIRLNWKEEVQGKFLEFKEKEQALQDQQKALEDLRTEFLQREEKLQARERELVKREQEIQIREKLARMTSVEDSKDSPSAVNITPRQQPSPAPAVVTFMKRLALSFRRKDKSKAKSSPQVSPRSSVKKRRESSHSVKSTSSSRPHSRDRSNSDAPPPCLQEQLSRLSLEPLDCNFRMRVGSENTKKSKKDSLDIPIHTLSLTKSSSFGSITTPTHQRPGDLSFNKSGASFLSPTNSLPPTKGLTISSSSLERDSGKESGGPDTPHSYLMQFESPVKVPARPVSVDDLFKLYRETESPFSTTSIDSAYIGAFRHATNSSGNASPCPPPASPTRTVIPRPKTGVKIARHDLIPCPPGFIRSASVEGTSNYSLSPCSSRSVSPCQSRKPSNSDNSPVGSYPMGAEHPLNEPVPPCLDEPLITSTPRIHNSKDFKFFFDQVYNNNKSLL